MRIAVGSDHRGFEVKKRILLLLTQLGHETQDMGTGGQDGVDYPDFAFMVAQAVGDKRVDRGILICGTGIGMCIAANKVPGLRAPPLPRRLTTEMRRPPNGA